MALSNTTVFTSDIATDVNDSVNYGMGNEDYAYDDYYRDVYMYPGYTFERPVYLYIWEILVIFVFLVNIKVIMVLLSKKMRNSTNMILTAIAISDSLTGLITLPSYIMVYTRYDPLPENYEDSVNNTNYEYIQSDIGNNFTYGYEDEYLMAQDGYTLAKSLCNESMISKYFLSKSFHTISIFLTLFLGIQRYVSVAYPFKFQSLFSERKVLIWCVAIVVVSPVLHSYHLGSNKAYMGLCKWHLDKHECGSDCIFLWVVFLLRHLIPCVTLLAFTGLIIWHLHLRERSLRNMDSTTSQLSRRVAENRRISIIVPTVVIVFLIPEISYSIFLLYDAILKITDNGQRIKLETNRAIHMSYELLLGMSFHANFYIYTFLNRKFRKCMYHLFMKPCQTYFRDT